MNTKIIILFLIFFPIIGQGSDFICKKDRLFMTKEHVVRVKKDIRRRVMKVKLEYKIALNKSRLAPVLLKFMGMPPPSPRKLEKDLFFALWETAKEIFRKTIVCLGGQPTLTVSKDEFGKILEKDYFFKILAKKEHGAFYTYFFEILAKEEYDKI